MYLDPFVPLELGHISMLLLIRSIRMELAVQNVFGRVLGIPDAFGSSLVPVLDRGENLQFPADP